MYGYLLVYERDGKCSEVRNNYCGFSFKYLLMLAEYVSVIAVDLGDIGRRLCSPVDILRLIMMILVLFCMHIYILYPINFQF